MPIIHLSITLTLPKDDLWILKLSSFKSVMKTMLITQCFKLVWYWIIPDKEHQCLSREGKLWFLNAQYEIPTFSFKNHLGADLSLISYRFFHMVIDYFMFSMGKVLAQMPPSEKSVGGIIKVTTPRTGPERKSSKGRPWFLVLFLFYTDPEQKLWDLF